VEIDTRNAEAGKSADTAEKVGFSVAVFEKQLKHGFLLLFLPVKTIPV
jgi:hypothetical protein